MIDGDVPVSAILTSASLHDSQVAIPLAKMSAERTVSLYDLAAAAYDAKEIRDNGRLSIQTRLDRHELIIRMMLWALSIVGRGILTYLVLGAVVLIKTVLQSGV